MRHCARRGLTFLEIMVVVTILAILIAVAVPNMAGPRARAALQSTARQLASAASLARQMAVAEQREAYLRFDYDKRLWRIALAEPEESSLSYAERRRRSDSAYTFEQPQSFLRGIDVVEIRSQGEVLEQRGTIYPEIVFYPNGSSSGGSILLQNARGRKMTVQVLAATGRAMSYVGEPRSSGDLLAAAGANLELFPGAQRSDDSAAGAGKSPGDGFYRSAGSEDERVRGYRSVAERLTQQLRSQYEMKIYGLDPSTYYTKIENGEALDR